MNCDPSNATDIRGSMLTAKERARDGRAVAQMAGQGPDREGDTQ